MLSVCVELIFPLVWIYSYNFLAKMRDVWHSRARNHQEAFEEQTKNHHRRCVRVRVNLFLIWWSRQFRGTKKTDAYNCSKTIPTADDSQHNWCFNSHVVHTNTSTILVDLCASLLFKHFFSHIKRIVCKSVWRIIASFRVYVRFNESFYSHEFR